MPPLPISSSATFNSNLIVDRRKEASASFFLSNPRAHNLIINKKPARMTGRVMERLEDGLLIRYESTELA